MAPVSSRRRCLLLHGRASTCRGLDVIGRLRRDHPFGFYARPGSKPDGSTDLMKWETGIPGKKGTDWEAGLFKVTMEFSEDYPSKPPKCKFVPPLFHPNVYPRALGAQGRPVELSSALSASGTSRGSAAGRCRRLTQHTRDDDVREPRREPRRETGFGPRLFSERERPLFLKVRDHLPVDPERGRGLAACHHHQADAPRCVSFGRDGRSRSGVPSPASLGVQDLLDTPNANSPAQSEAYQLFVQDKVEYKKRIRAEAAKNAPTG